MAQFFINHPIFAWVVSILIMLGGALSILRLPVAQYPSIAPPTVQISSTYPGASAQTVQDTVTQVIEQQMNGLDNLLYMSSTSDSSGTSSILLSFATGTNPDIAQVQVQNKLQLATPLLPVAVQEQGIRITKSSRNYLMFLALSSRDDSLSAIDLGNILSSQVKDIIGRVNGVGDVLMFSPEYAMRIWLDPNKLNSFNLTPSDVSAAVLNQNVQISAGELGALPAQPGQQINVTITAQSLLQSPEEFNNILLKVNPDGSQVRIKDVGRAEIGGDNYEITGRVNGKPAAILAIRLATGANALATATAVKNKMNELAPFLDKSIAIDYPYDTTPFISVSIEEVVKTLLIAILLVFLVMYLFLQNLRATLIPTIAVPVALLGTFGVMAMLGFSINVLTMFGLVLAIGLLVDDAIVVVENVERIMAEEKLSAKEATKKAMHQITGALVGIATVLTAVFIPMAFFSGSVGQIYRQFSLTMASAMVISVFIALSLTPALCATILKPGAHQNHERSDGFFAWFNIFFAKSRNGYKRLMGVVIKRAGRFFILYGAIIAAVLLLFKSIPTAFLPDEDQGYFILAIQMPVGSPTAMGLEIIKKVEDFYLHKETKVDKLITVSGVSFNGRGQNSALAFVRLKDWKERTDPQQSAKAIIARSYQFFSQLKGTIAFAFNPPPIPELGTSSGISFELEDRAGLGHAKLMEARNMLLGLAAQDPTFKYMRPSGMEDAPVFQVDIDQEKASALGLAIPDVYNTLEISFGSAYINNFIYRGRIHKVFVQGDSPYRMMPEDVGKWFVRSSSNTMVPFSAFSTSHWGYSSPQLERYNGIPAVGMLAEAAPGRSTGEAMAAIEELMKKLPEGFGIEWGDQSLEERASNEQTPYLFSLSILVVFLCLAALYESWAIPISVMLVVPLGVIGTLLAVKLFGMNNDVYLKVGVLITIGLATKNAILIIEFAKTLHEQGKNLFAATLEAAQLRLRPILMTSLAFIFGVLPLALNHGAGSASQNEIGIGVIGGMLTATFLAIFFVPIFFVTITKIFKKNAKNNDDISSTEVNHHV